MDKTRNQFWDYLQTSGAENALSEVLQKLYNLDEKPTNAVEFLMNNLDPALSQKLEAQSKEIESLKKQLAELKNKNRKQLNLKMIQNKN